MFENRRWLVIPTTILESVDFNEVLEKDINSLRKSIDGTKTFIKYEINEVLEEYTEEYYDAEDPTITHTNTIEVGVYGRPSIYSEEYNEYNHQEILSLLSTNEWSVNDIKE
tara:strand:+ start:556 stop:888 length:333 start_codon:yes stop_codon:yes gene_type:complete